MRAEALVEVCLPIGEFVVDGAGPLAGLEVKHVGLAIWKGGGEAEERVEEEEELHGW